MYVCIYMCVLLLLSLLHDVHSVETLVSDLLRTFSNLVVEVTGVNSKKFVTAVNVSEKLKEVIISNFLYFVVGETCLLISNVCMYCMC